MYTFNIIADTAAADSYYDGLVGTIEVEEEMTKEDALYDFLLFVQEQSDEGDSYIHKIIVLNAYKAGKLEAVFVA